MALAGTWSFSVNRDEIIREALLNVGAIGESEVPTAQEVTDCARKLNMMVKQWMGSQDFAPGLKMWERQRGELFLRSDKGVYDLGPNSQDHWAGYTKGQSISHPYGRCLLIADAAAGSNSFFTDGVTQMNVGDQVGIFVGPDLFWSTINAVSSGSNNFQIPGPGITSGALNGSVVYNYTTQAQRPLGIITCSLRDMFAQDIPVQPMTIQDYENLPTKVSTQYISDPMNFYYESQFSSGTDISSGGLLFLDVGGSSDASKHLHIVYVRPIMDMNNPGDNPEYPQQWYRALCWGLSREIAGMFDAEWSGDMEANYDQSLAIAREGDPETTTFYFQPNVTDPYS